MRKRSIRWATRVSQHAATFVWIKHTGLSRPCGSPRLGFFEVSSSFLIGDNKMKKLLLRSAVSAASLFAFPLLPATCRAAQGCVAAHSPQPVISGLDPTNQAAIAHSAGTNFLHGLTISTGYRVYNSYRHYIGTDYQEQRQTQHFAVVNHVNLFELDLNYQLTPRWSVIASDSGDGSDAPWSTDATRTTIARVGSGMSLWARRHGFGVRRQRAMATWRFRRS